MPQGILPYKYEEQLMGSDLHYSQFQPIFYLSDLFSWFTVLTDFHGNAAAGLRYSGIANTGSLPKTDFTSLFIS